MHPKTDSSPPLSPRKLLNRVLSPVHAGEYETRRHTFWWMLIRVALFGLLITITAFFREQGNKVLLPPAEATNAFLVVICVYSIASAALLGKLIPPVRRFALLQLLSDTFFISLLIYGTGCSQSIFTPMLLLPVVTGGLILYKRGGLILATAATLLYGAVLVTENFQLLPKYYTTASFAYKHPESPLAALNLFAIYGLIFFLSALFSGQLARRLRFTEEKLTKTSLEYDRLSILYKQIFDNINTGIITTDQNDFITSYNAAAERITGYPQQEVLGRSFGRCFPDIFFLQEQSGRNVCDFKKHDGSATRVGYSFSQLNMPTAVEGGQTSWKVITLQDVSQIERMEQQVRETEKMAAIGEISASIAHDFRNPLAAISGSAQILTMEHNQTSPMNPETSDALVRIILRESDRMAKTITDFLQFARPAPLEPELFDLSVLVNEMITALQRGKYASAAARIRSELEVQLICWADRQQMQTILKHLLENACQAMEETQGEIVVRAWEQQPHSLCLEIRDQGPGIAPELREKVFTPFYSGRTDGAGMGLAIVRQIIENHHGRIELDDDEDHACIVRLCLEQTATSA